MNLLQLPHTKLVDESIRAFHSDVVPVPLGLLLAAERRIARLEQSRANDEGDIGQEGEKIVG